VALFFVGMAINLHSDYTLIFLRKPGESGYKIPHGALPSLPRCGDGCLTAARMHAGGMFEYVSGANFLGEILEWCGFALASWAFVPAAFALFTAANIGPRALQHHQ
jgi:3-oxo-5-alpha-steroid 4-dehydrogenase 1